MVHFKNKTIIPHQEVGAGLVWGHKNVECLISGLCSSLTYLSTHTSVWRDCFGSAGGGDPHKLGKGDTTSYTPSPQFTL